MPATAGRRPARALAVGVDGCRGGWVCVTLDARGTARLDVRADFAACMRDAGAGAGAVLVDMPIGLAEAERRACEAMARARLKPKRHSSVFPSPARPMLAFDAYEDANAWGKAQGPGFGLSKQAWMITPKIREVDAWMTPRRQRRVGEGHPEVAFWRLRGGAPCEHNKKTAEGFAERVAALADHGLADIDPLLRAAKDAVGAGVARDDVVDACALALSARARLEGAALRLSDDARDARGLVMEIWG